MKIILSQNEVDNVIDYVRAEQNDPCKGCYDNNGACCGCPEQREYCNALKAIKPSQELLDIKNLVSYAKTIIAMENNLNQANKLKKEYEQLNAECMRLKDLFCIENDSGEQY